LYMVSFGKPTMIFRRCSKIINVSKFSARKFRRN
jgi:hypothetical protein